MYHSDRDQVSFWWLPLFIYADCRHTYLWCLSDTTRVHKDLARHRSKCNGSIVCLTDGKMTCWYSKLNHMYHSGRDQVSFWLPLFIHADCRHTYLWALSDTTRVHKDLARHSTGCFIWLVLPQKVLSMELVPPNKKKWLSPLEMAKIRTKKVKVCVRVCQTFTFCCKLAGSDLDFHFFSRDFCHLQWT